MLIDDPADGNHSLRLATVLLATMSSEEDTSPKNLGLYSTEEVTQGSRMPSIITAFETEVAKSEGGATSEIPLSHLPARHHQSRAGSHSLALSNSTSIKKSFDASWI